MEFLNQTKGLKPLKPAVFLVPAGGDTCGYYIVCVPVLSADNENFKLFPFVPNCAFSPVCMHS